MKKILIVILVLLNYSDVMAKELRGWKALEIGMDFDKAHDIVKTICKTRRQPSIGSGSTSQWALSALPFVCSWSSSSLY